MSGTSCDGVDAALVRIAGRGDAMTAAYIDHVETSFEPEFRRNLLEIREAGGCSFRELAELGRTLTLAYAAAVTRLLEQSNTKSSDVAAVAAHGQTLFHDPPDTIQWLDPSLLAAEVGMAVVSDFRRADCAAGGQGAPLVPFGDWVFFRRKSTSPRSPQPWRHRKCDVSARVRADRPRHRLRHGAGMLPERSPDAGASPGVGWRRLQRRTRKPRHPKPNHRGDLRPRPLLLREASRQSQQIPRRWSSGLRTSTDASGS